MKHELLNEIVHRLDRLESKLDQSLDKTSKHESSINWIKLILSGIGAALLGIVTGFHK